MYQFWYNHIRPKYHQNQTIYPINTYNSTYHRTVKRKHINVKGKESNDKNPKFKIADHVRISKYKNIFLTGYTPNYLEEVFVIKKNKMQCHRHMLLMILTVKKLLERLMKKNCN